MSALLCGLTGTSPEEPVFSKTGYIFEKRVIEKYLKANSDTCPITGEPLSIDDLIPLKVSKTVRPRPATATSIPGLLASLQNEWDSLMTETFNLRTHLDSVRNQLSHSLYQHDAACRVIARLVKEKDNLRQELSRVQDQTISSLEGGKTVGAMGDVGFPPNAIEELQTLAKSLLSQRKKRCLDSLTSVESVKSFKESGSYSPHSSTVPGIVCCTIDTLSEEPEKDRQVWTGGNDGVISLFNLSSQKTLARLQGHLKKINSVVKHPTSPIVISASDDKTVRLWNSPDGSADEYKMSYILRNHSKPVTSLSIHPSGDYFVSSSKDQTWMINDLTSGRICRIYKDLPCIMPSVAFHPDGMLIGACGLNNLIYIYDLKASDQPMVSLAEHQTPVTDIAFSQNGYYLATASSAEGGVVKLWDLRKSANFQTIQPVTTSGIEFSPFKIKFDHSGNYLAVCGGGVTKNVKGETISTQQGCLSLYHFESRTSMQKLSSLEGHTERVTDACFGPQASYLVSTSLDRTVKLWAETA